MQERALELVGKKLSASLAIEGKLTDDGLASLSAGDDLTLMLARALIEGAQIDGAESVWRSMNEKRADMRRCRGRPRTSSRTTQEPVLGGARRTLAGVFWRRSSACVLRHDKWKGKDRQRFLKLVLQVWSAIEGHAFFPREDWHCSQCAYADHCRVW